jgi:electron transport complex protein RnfD
LISVIFSVAFAFGAKAVLKQKADLFTLLDTAVSGAVFAFTLPVSVPYYIPMLGGVLAAVPSLWLPGGRKPFFGGFFAAAAVRTFFSKLLSRATQAFVYVSPFIFNPTEADINSFRTYTPLQLLAQGKVSSGTLWDQFYGTISGNIGEISFMLLLLGCIFLLVRKKNALTCPCGFCLCFVSGYPYFPQGR